MQKLRIALAQMNAHVGDLNANVRKIIQNIERAKSEGAGIVVLPELAVCGYPPEDLLLKPAFLRDCRDAVEECAEACDGLMAVIGFPDHLDDTYNAAAMCADGAIQSIYHKQFLPNYGVFDENRYFQTGSGSSVLHLPLSDNDESGDDTVIIGVNVCEDIWYSDGPLRDQALVGDAELVINLSASPYHRGKGLWRAQMLGTRAADHVCVVAFCNLVGGQDELIFDGQSMIFDQHGAVIARAKQFQEDFLVADLDMGGVFRERLHDPRRRKAKAALTDDERRIERIFVPEGVVGAVPTSRVEARREPVPEPVEEVYEALVLGTRDYVKKCGFRRAFIGLSGGVDSALVAAIACDAIGPDNVLCASMPSQFSSEGSKSDAQLLADNFGLRLITLPIADVFEDTIGVLKTQLSDEFAQFGLAEENLQARIRGNLLMTISNKLNGLVLTTGNKSESAVGYSTLYGDTAGGLAVIKDVPKTLVYELCRFRNAREGREMIPEAILTKAPSAELRPDQKDSDSLPDYDTLDAILKMYVEEDRSISDIIAEGYSEEVVRRVIRLVDLAEYKRRQNPPGLKITPRAFGRDRRLPIVNGYRETPPTREQQKQLQAVGGATPSEGEDGIGAIIGTGGVN